MTAEVLMHSAQPVAWPQEIDEIFAGDLVVAVASPTAGGGVVINSVTPLGLRNREAGTVSYTTSLGFGRKLERIAADPRIAVAYHTRQHGHSDRAGFALVQGIAVIRKPGERQLKALADQASRHCGQVAEGRFWGWWLAVYYRDRVVVDINVRRILWWPDGVVSQPPQVIGDPLPTAHPPVQTPPRDAGAPRVPLRKIRRAVHKEHVLLSVLMADGMPLITPASVQAIDDHSVQFDVVCPLLPTGARRAGVLAHSFHPKLVGLSNATATGWLDVGECIAWTPHSLHGFTAPPNKTLLLLGNGAAARWGYRKALRQGRQEILKHARGAGRG